MGSGLLPLRVEHFDASSFLNSSVPFANCQLLTVDYLPRLPRLPATGLRPPVLKLFVPSPAEGFSHEIAALATSP